MGLLSAPSLSGVMNVSSSQQNMGQGLTDRTFLVGHSDGLPINDPYQVASMSEAFAVLNVDSTSPLARTLLETYHGGCRDIWLVATAPMSEYEPDPTLRDNAYYAAHKARLDITYAILQNWDLVQTLVLIEAPFYNAHGIDFATQLANHCESSFQTTGSIRIGLIGVRTGYGLSTIDIDAIASDPRIGTFGPGGKYIMAIAGEGVYNFTEMSTSYMGSAIGSIAAMIAATDLRSSLVYKSLPGMLTLNGSLTNASLSKLAESQINPIALTTRGVRGKQYEVVVMTDNTLADAGSDFWSIGQTRLVMKVMEGLVTLGHRYMGTIGYIQFRKDCEDFMRNLEINRYLKSSTINVYKESGNNPNVYVEVTLTPYIDLRQISFTATIGP